MEKSALDRALDLFVFAPLGLAVAARDALPELIDKGRQQLSGQVTTARMMGEMAVAQGQREADKAISQVTQRLAGLKLFPDGRRSPSPAGPEERASSTAGAEARPEAGPRAGPQPTVTADDLAIPGYDSLSAPQVVQRLAGLSSEELELVRQYEAATRHRKTILTRISQLQSPQP